MLKTLKLLIKALESEGNWVFCRGESQGWPMKTSRIPFRKTTACPASATLVSYRCQNLPAEMATPVSEHLKVCDFCCAELRLLAYDQPSTIQYPTPEIPMNLRILAESILNRG